MFYIYLLKYGCDLIVFFLYSPPAVERLSSGLFQEVIITNTLPVMEKNYFPQLTVLSVANLLGETIWRVHDDCSVSSIFQWHGFLCQPIASLPYGWWWRASCLLSHPVMFLSLYPSPFPLHLHWLPNYFARQQRCCKAGVFCFLFPFPFTFFYLLLFRVLTWSFLTLFRLGILIKNPLWYCSFRKKLVYDKSL